MKLQDYVHLVLNGYLDNSLWQKAEDEWKRFLEGDPVDLNIVPVEVYQSWLRSKQHEVDPYGQNSFILDDSRKRELEQFRALEQSYWRFFNSVIELLDQDQFTLSFGTPNGLRRQIVNKAGLPFPSLIGECSEKTVGTTASSLAVHENRPVLLTHQFFYRRPYLQGINSAAAPLHNEKGEIIGTISLGFYDLTQAKRAYWLVEWLAKAFDIFYLPLTKGHEKQVMQIIDLLPQGIALINHKNISYCNKTFEQLLNIKGQGGRQEQLKKVFSLIDSDSPKTREWQLDVAGKAVKASVKVSPLRDEINERSYQLVQLLQNNECTRLSQGCKGCHSEGFYTFDRIIGQSPGLIQAKTIAQNVALTSVPVLLFGENGTGKELFAQAIHSASPRYDKPFVAINCGAIPDELVESELFGYEEGAFTGAIKGGKIGKIEAANGGTLFLDEIESMPLQDQVKLLRVLASGKIQRLGSTKEIPVDVRVISATKKDLLQEADHGHFREDLYFRISTIVIELPPLRERIEDIPLLTAAFVSKFCHKYGLPEVQMEQEFLDALSAYHWRGNVRELEHTLERIIILKGEAKVLTFEHLPRPIRDAYQTSQVKNIVSHLLDQNSPQGLLALGERMIIEYVLKRANGNVSEAAQLLGVNRRTIYNKLKEYPALKANRK